MYIYLYHGKNCDRAVQRRGEFCRYAISFLSILWGGIWFGKHLQPGQYFPACEGAPAAQANCTSSEYGFPSLRVSQVQKVDAVLHG